MYYRYNVPLALPEIVVVGMQSVGKSSLIEAFAGLRLNNCGYGIYCFVCETSFFLLFDSKEQRPDVL